MYNKGVNIDFGFPDGFIAFKFYRVGDNGREFLWRYDGQKRGLGNVTFGSELLTNYIGGGYNRPTAYVLLQDEKKCDFQLLCCSRGVIGATKLLEKTRKGLIGIKDSDLDIFRRENEIIRDGLKAGQPILRERDAFWSNYLYSNFINEFYLQK